MQHITIHTPTNALHIPETQADIERRWTELLGEPAEVAIRPCAKCPRPVIVLDGGLASTATP